MSNREFYRQQIQEMTQVLKIMNKIPKRECHSCGHKCGHFGEIAKYCCKCGVKL